MVIIIKRIYYKNYNPNLGILIDVENPANYKKNPIKWSINIYKDKLLLNYKTLLTKSKKYYIICSKGNLSRNVVAILEFYGYDVTQVIK